MNGDPAKARKSPKARTAYLFVQTANDVELVPLRRRTNAYTLTLRGLQPTVYFSDRPVRKAGHETTAKFVASWAKGSESFAENPPNAELVVFNAGKAPLALTLELTDPQWDSNRPDRLSYTAMLVGDSTRPAATVCGSGALYIDSIEDEELMM